MSGFLELFSCAGWENYCTRIWGEKCEKLMAFWEEIVLIGFICGWQPVDALCVSLIVLKDFLCFLCSSTLIIFYSDGEFGIQSTNLCFP